MRNEFEAQSRLTEEQAIARLDYYLRSIGYKAKPPGSRSYERGRPGAAIYVTRPHLNHARITLELKERPDGVTVAVVQEVFRYGQPTSQIDKQIFRGELDDIRSVLEGKRPTIDRVQQNVYAGNLAAYLILLIIAPAVAAAGFHQQMEWFGWLVCAAVMFGAIFGYLFAPIRVPDFPLKQSLPDSEFESPYPRD